MKLHRRWCFRLCQWGWAWLLIVTPLWGQWVLLTRQADSLAQITLEHIYHQRFDSAAHLAVVLQEQFPDHPVGYFLDALVDWWRIYLHQRVHRYDERFLEKVERTLEITDRLLEKNPYDIVGLFFAGAARGYRGRYYVIREQWIQALIDGKAGFDIISKLWKLAPGNSDILLGIAIYHYFAAVFPEKYPLLKPLMTFLPPGSREGGLQELEYVAQHARYVRIEAKMLLLQIYYQFENAPERTEKLARELLALYPENLFVRKYLGRALVRLGKRKEMEQQWRKVLLECMAGHYGCDSYLVREATYYIGYALLLRGEYEMAIKYLRKSLEFSRVIDDDEPSGFWVETALKLGDADMRLGKKKEAVQWYKQVLELPEFRSSYSRAKRRLKNLEGAG